MEKKLTDEEVMEVVGALEKSKLKLSKNALVLIQYLQKELEEKEYFRQKWGKMFIQKKREAKKLKEEKEDLGKQLHERALKYCTLQAENERLTEELDGTVSMNEMYIKEAKQNVELQKQVDELKENQVIECHGMLKGCDMVKQAVKDTAKEIIVFVEEKDKKAGKYSIYRTLLQELKEKYEVE